MPTRSSSRVPAPVKRNKVKSPRKTTIPPAASRNGSPDKPQTRDSIRDIWGARTPYIQDWPARVDLAGDPKPETWVQSCCLLCSNGCALDIGVTDGKMVAVRGRAQDRVNRGRLGPKGLHGWVANQSADRLTQPLIRRQGELQPAPWDEAMELIVQKTRETIGKYSSDAVGFYSSGQLMLEEFYTLSIIANAGIGTSNIDGNTRLCTATAEQALCETFGTDGQPGSYGDIDVTDCLFLVGHNLAETQTVLWARILDRLRGPRPPRLIVVDPRETPTARQADVHLAPRLGTNVAVLNGLMHLMIKAGHVDQGFLDQHTVNFPRLAEVVRRYPPERIEEITGIPAAKLRAAAKILGTTPTLVSTVLQGVYQSNQATAAACQVNNLNLLRGMIGKPGCTVFQMNGQPSAQNTRETGCNGELPAFRNWENPAHVEDLAKRWNVDSTKLPVWHEHAHAMEIFRRAELGSVRMLWIVCTNPAVTLPELHRIRRILAQEKLFVVAQDAFLTETAELADVVLPAAIWGEKTGTITNTDRTVHLCRQAIDPPGQARSDLDIFLDYARRMEFRDQDGKPLVKWKDAEGAFEHWKACSRGWPCDYSDLTYVKLSGGSGIQWPCNELHPEGKERLYGNHIFATAAEVCRTFGHDLETGAAVTPEDYRAHDPAGRAVLKAAEYLAPFESPDKSYPFYLTTGRVVYHFHTRTKTGRSMELQQAAPECFVQIHEDDARELGIEEGDAVEVSSRRGSVQAAARLGGVERETVFLPFHYGYWDADTGEHHRAANELTLTIWDPVSKQPGFKYAAVSVRKAETSLGKKVANAAGKALDRAKETTDKVLSAAHKTRRHLADYLSLTQSAHEAFAKACATVASQHLEETEVQQVLEHLAEMSRQAAQELKQAGKHYGTHRDRSPEQIREELFPSGRAGAFGLFRDLHDLSLLASNTRVGVQALLKAAQALRDEELTRLMAHQEEQTRRQYAWFMSELQHRAGHVLVVPQ